MDFTMTNMEVQSYMAEFSAEQMAFFSGFPIWVTITWGIAVWGAVLGAVLILLRKRLAVPVFAIALVALLATSLHNFVLSDIKIYNIVGAGALGFSAMILLVAVLLLVYSRAQARLGRLR